MKELELDRVRRLGPPKPLYTELDEILEHVVAVLPSVSACLSPLTGGKVWTQNKKNKKWLSRHVRTLGLSLRPMLLLDLLADNKISAERFNYGVFEAYIRTLMVLNGTTVNNNDDAGQVLLDMSLKFANPYPKRITSLKAYREAQAAVTWLSDCAAERGHEVTTKRIYDAWANSPAQLAWFAFVERFDRASNSWVLERPGKFTKQTIDKLTNQYRELSTVVEMRLKLVAALLYALDGHGDPWGTVEHSTLNNLIQKLHTRPEVAPLSNMVNRNVRNALAHSAPIRNASRRCVTFHDAKKEVVWSFEELFENTRSLTLMMFSLVTLEPNLNYAALRHQVLPMWERLQSESTQHNVVEAGDHESDTNNSGYAEQVA